MQIKGIMKRSLLKGFLETLCLNRIFGLCIPLKNSDIATLHHLKPQARNSVVNITGTNQSRQPKWLSKAAGGLGGAVCFRGDPLACTIEQRRMHGCISHCSLRNPATALQSGAQLGVCVSSPWGNS